MSEQASGWRWFHHEVLDLFFTVSGLALVVGGAMTHSMVLITTGFAVEVGATVSTVVMWRWR